MNNRKVTKVLTCILVILIIIAGALMAKEIFLEKEEKEQTENEFSQTTVANVTENTETNPEQPQETEETNLENVSDLFGAYYEKAKEQLQTMTLEEKVGQMFLARYPKEAEQKEIEALSPGGYILFGDDFKGETKTSILQKLSTKQQNSKIKLALGVDEEGGTVVRVSQYKAFRSTKFESPQALWKKGQLALILKDSTEKSTLLKSIGLNMNLAPVADVPTSSSDFIYARAYGRGAENTATYVSKLVETMNKDGMISTLKHFPGYGNNADTHTGVAVDKRPYATFETSDFLPFKSGIEAKAPTILVSHTIVECMDKEKPASLSENIHKILREELGFTGIIMTDDLAMDAVKAYVENGEAAVQAVLAGNDIILSSDMKTQKEEILQAVADGKIQESTINTAVQRILAWKYAYQICA